MPTVPKPTPAQLVTIGEQAIWQLQALETKDRQASVDMWKSLLEDPLSRQSGMATAVRAAIRAEHGGVIKTSYGVIVCGRAFLMEVYLDTQERYSVKGYAERMKQSFGRIYLGLDKGKDYDAQSAATNQAIGTISERAAFELALKETRAALVGAAGSFDLDDVSVAVLAATCRTWFNVPDDKNVLAGGFSLFLTPPRCPGHYAAPSGYIFKPDPNFIIRYLGRESGKKLHDGVARFVAAQRATGQPPSGVISSVIFSVYPNTPDGNEMVTRTIIGVMMGFLPTVDGNLHNVVKAWLEDLHFEVLQNAYRTNPESDLYKRAIAVIQNPLMQGMQASPVPDQVWRTAIKDHALGKVQVKSGDRIVLDIAGATEEDLAAGVTNVMPIFGGDRKPNPHPTHACPGYAAGMGVMMGIIAGLLERDPGAPKPLVTDRGAPL